MEIQDGGPGGSYRSRSNISKKIVERDLKLLPEEHTHVNSWPGPCSVPAKQEVAEEEVIDL